MSSLLKEVHMKKLLFKQRSDFPHWVGDGFPVRSIFSYNNVSQDISPFLLLDYAGPTVFPATDKVRGVGEHPHRGFETVTIVYDGEVEHRDSAGGGGIIRQGDVQWMTAASGLVHEERHGREFAKSGGPFEMVQLWVNLPKKHKMTSPRYQGIKNESIPAVTLPGNAGTLRVIAGEYEGTQGPAHTFSQVNLWDIRLAGKHKHTFPVPAGHTAAVFVLGGKVKLADGTIVEEAEIAFLSHDGDEVSMEALEDAKILFLGGEPLNEPVFGYGPFVMNTHQEIGQAFRDFEAGKMGVLNKIEGAE
jgi:redox-sensitive bicupin YhaK (pirin superfamily)